MKTKPWKLIFEEYGGYDCMTSAYYIYASNDELVLIIDLGDFEDRNEAIQIAQSIVDANQ